jgi:hypothetical protein
MDFSQLTPAVVTGQLSQLKQTLRHIKSIKMGMIVRERGQVATPALQLVDTDDRPKLKRVVE